MQGGMSMIEQSFQSMSLCTERGCRTKRKLVSGQAVDETGASGVKDVSVARSRQSTTKSDLKGVYYRKRFIQIRRWTFLHGKS